MTLKRFLGPIASLAIGAAIAAIPATASAQGWHRDRVSYDYRPAFSVQIAPPQLDVCTPAYGVSAVPTRPVFIEHRRFERRF